MREIYRGNGFVITTNDSGEIFVQPEGSTESLRISHEVAEIRVSYANTLYEMLPTGFKQVGFRAPIKK